MSESIKQKSRRRDRTPSPGLGKQLQAILNRLNALEDSRSSVSAVDARTGTPPAGPASGRAASASPPSAPLVVPACVDSRAPSTAASTTTHSDAGMILNEVTEKLVSAINTIPVRSNHIYISNFDPTLHDFIVWCDEVDHVRKLNRWDDRECLARIGNCLKGDARLWLNEWSTNDRSWLNFKREFTSLCPRRLDVANILFNVMKTDSTNYPTYAEYARRSLLRLRIVNGLSDELITAIVIRGITDPHIRAAATNAKLMPDDIVNFLSIYVKPSDGMPVRSKPRDSFRKPDSQPNTRNREYNNPKIKCFSCGGHGHKQSSCSKRVKLDDRIQ